MSGEPDQRPVLEREAEVYWYTLVFDYLRSLALGPGEWRKSTYSAHGSTCVEVARNLPAIITIRDSKDPDGPRWSSPPTSGRHSLPAFETESSTSAEPSWTIDRRLQRIAVPAVPSS